MRTKNLITFLTLLVSVSLNQVKSTQTVTINEELDDLAHRLNRIETKIIRIVSTNSALGDLEKKVKELEDKTARLVSIERNLDENNSKLRSLMAKFPANCHELYHLNPNSFNLKSGPYVVYPSKLPKK
jgi:chromosome segregation ATPase